MDIEINRPDRKLLPRRRPTSHKGDFGRTLMIGGSRGMSGAIALAGLAALRAGAGLVRLAVPQEIAPIVAGYEPSYMTLPLPQDPEGCLSWEAREALRQAATQATVLACGPGLGAGAARNRLVHWLYQSVEAPLVLDADGLNAMAEDADLSDHAGPRILTPHPGEMRRLVPGSDGGRETQCKAAIELAAKHELVVVLKGHHTWITDGKSSWENHTGNPGMATGGSGDVLTGMVAGLVAQHIEPLEAARLAVFLHGLAADLAVKKLGQISLIASDLIQWLPAAVLDWQSREDDDA